MSYEPLTVNLNSDASIDSVMTKVARLVETTPPGAQYANYRLLLKTGAYANITLGPVLFTRVDVLPADERIRFEHTSGTLSKASAEKLTKFLGALAYLATVSTCTQGRGLMPLPSDTLENGSTVAIVETRNLAAEGSAAHGVRRKAMQNAATCAQRHTASFLQVSGLSFDNLRGSGLIVEWLHAFRPHATGTPTFVVPRALPAPEPAVAAAAPAAAAAALAPANYDERTDYAVEDDEQAQLRSKRRLEVDPSPTPLTQVGYDHNSPRSTECTPNPPRSRYA